MTTFIQIQWSCGNLEEARKVSRFLVQEQYVACVHIIPQIESIFLWKNQLDTAQETKVSLKTRAENFDAVKEIILERSSYELPEIIATPISNGHKEYLAWLEENTSDFSKKVTKA